MSPVQSNTIEGLITMVAGEDLTGKEGYLAKVTNNSGVAEARLPAAVTDRALYVIDEGAASGSRCTLRPLIPGRQIRIKTKGTANPGALAVPATTGDFGKVRADASGLGGGSSILLGVFEEVAVDGQLSLIRLIAQPTVTLTT